MKKTIGIGIILLCLMVLSVPTGVAEVASEDIEISLRGGIGVHGYVVNNGESSVSGNLQIKIRAGQVNNIFFVPPEVSMPIVTYQIAVFSPIDVVLEVGSQSLSKTGFIVGVFVVLI